MTLCLAVAKDINIEDYIPKSEARIFTLHQMSGLIQGAKERFDSSSVIIFR